MVPLELWKRYSRDARVRFFAAGSTAASLSWVIRFPLNVFMTYPQAVLAATAISMVYSFVLYRTWVFPGSERRLRQQIRDFAGVNLFAMMATVAIAVMMERVIENTGLPDTVAQALAHAVGIAGGAVLNYLGHRWITFRHG